MSNTEVLIEVRDHVQLMTLNRPDKMNAWTETMMDQITDAIRAAAHDPSVRAVVVTGAGRAFCIGPDHGVLAKLADVPDAAIRAGYGTPRRLIDAVRALEKPVIAAINGICVSGGLEFAMAADLRIAGSNARFGYPDTKLGLIPAIGGTVQLARLIGVDRAKMMIFGAELIDARTAFDWRLVTESVEDGKLLGRAVELGELFASRAPLAVGLAKYVMTRAEDSEMNLAIAAEALAASLARRTEDHEEGMAAFREKREPRFRAL